MLTINTGCNDSSIKINFETTWENIRFVPINHKISFCPKNEINNESKNAILQFAGFDTPEYHYLKIFISDILNRKLSKCNTDIVKTELDSIYEMGYNSDVKFDVNEYKEFINTKKYKSMFKFPIHVNVIMDNNSIVDSNDKLFCLYNFNEIIQADKCILNKLLIKEIIDIINSVCDGDLNGESN